MEIGKVKLKNRVIYAPMAGCSDFPTRKLVRRFFNPGLIFCEMMKIEPLVRGIKGCMDIMDYSEEMRPIGAQLCGSDPQIAKEAAKIVEKRGFDILDFNFGCPVKKVVKDGSGSGMLQDLELLKELLCEVSSAITIPLTIKIRAGWDDENICIEEVVKIAEESGVKALFIHGRTREQLYKGKANWEFVKRAKEAAKSIKIVGNGDVFKPEDAKRIFEETLCDGVLVARGTLGRPWFADQIESYLRGEVYSIEVEEIKNYLLEHIKYVIEYREGRKVLLDVKKVAFWYLKALYGTKPLRIAIAKCLDEKEIVKLIEDYGWEKNVKMHL